MDIDGRKPEEILKPEYIQQYKELHDDIWKRLIHVHTNIIILEHIEKFPFEHFYAPQENIFWTMVYWNFLYVTIVFLYSLTNDKGSKKHTLLQFKNVILSWMKDTEKQEYRNKLKITKFKGELKRTLDKVDQMRNCIIAHRFLNHKGGWGVRDVEGLTVSEIRKVYNNTEKLFRACSFGSEYVTTLYLDGTCAGKPIEKDIDKLLDLIVKDSFWLNQPEIGKQYWQVDRQCLSEEELQELNNCRKKFGLPHA